MICRRLPVFSSPTTPDRHFVLALRAAVGLPVVYLLFAMVCYGAFGALFQSRDLGSISG
jgi:hypothetical protein